MLVVNGVLVVATIAATILAIVSQHWWQLVYAAFLLLMGLGNLQINRLAIRRAQESRTSGF